MVIKHKSGGTYADVAGVFHKRSGVYEAVQGVYVKTAGAYALVSSPAGDPYFANVKLLMTGDGANGSTTITDIKGNAVTNNSVATISNAVVSPGFSEQILLADTAGGLTVAGSNADFAITDDATLEGFITPTNVGGNTIYFWNIAPADNGNHFYLKINTNGSLSGQYGGGALAASSAGLIANNTRYFVQVLFDGTLEETRLYVDGALASTTSWSVATSTGAVTIYLNRAFNLDFGGGYRFAGRMEEVRLTKGVLRPTTVPTAPFPVE